MEVIAVAVTSSSRTRVHMLTAAILRLCAIAASASQQKPDNPAASKPPTVLFMCPHGAAKSVLASAYFQQLATERGLNVRVASAGTDPDPQIAPAVAKHLKANGYEVPATKPRRVTADDMSSADVVVSIGCELEGLPAPRGRLVKWDDVPAPSEDFARADAKIREHVMQLIDEVMRGKTR